jgi:3-methyl-2-oxobutanoate hydroxymethyltransferase
LEKHTILSIQRKKKDKQPLVALTCYDAATARLIDEAGVDIALVGDSLANTRLGYPNTIPVTVDEMLHHVRASARGVHSALLVADMPFHSYEAAPWKAVLAAGRFIKEGGASAVKLEGGRRVGASIRRILDANIPVMGHLGLTPQSVHRDGGYHVKGRVRAEAEALLRDARYLQSLGVFSLVLEGIPAALGKKITHVLKIPTIGIGAGPWCDGQILVFDDLVGLTGGPSPKFVKRYADSRTIMAGAIARYAADVRSHRFPTEATSYR